MAFERFTKNARELVAAAEAEARALAADAVGPDHLLVAYVVRTHSGAWLLPPHDWPGAVVRHAIAEERERQARLEVWHARTITADALRAAIVQEEAEALAQLGISLEAVREQVERTFGPASWSASSSPGRLPFTADAKRVLERALREALDLRQRRLTGEHVLLALLGEARVRALLARLGVQADELQGHVRAALASVGALATR